MSPQGIQIQLSFISLCSVYKVYFVLILTSGRQLKAMTIDYIIQAGLLDIRVCQRSVPFPSTGMFARLSMSPWFCVCILSKFRKLCVLWLLSNIRTVLYLFFLPLPLCYLSPISLVKFDSYFLPFSFVPVTYYPPLESSDC